MERFERRLLLTASGGIGDVIGAVEGAAVGGQADVIGYHEGLWYVGLSTGTDLVKPQEPAAVWTNAEWDALRQGDFNGDGLADVLGLIDGAWWVGLADGAGKFVTKGTPWEAWSSVAWENVLVGDLNGDGSDDVLAAVADGGYQYWYGALSNGVDGFGGRAVWYCTNDVDWLQASLGDMNADGLSDLILQGVQLSVGWYIGYSNGTGDAGGGTFVVPKYSGAFGYSIETDVLLGDFNDDGLMDLAAFYMAGHPAGYTVILASLTGFGDGMFQGISGEGKYVSQGGSPRPSRVLIGDLNGDGADDMLVELFAENGGGQWYTSLSILLDPLTPPNRGFAAAKLWYSARGTDVTWDEAMLADMNGDGRQDLVLLLDGAWYVGLSNGTGDCGVPQLWGSWADTEWEAVAGGDVGEPVVAAAGAAFVREEDDPGVFWLRAEEDEEFVEGLMAGV